jgi:LuxR family transcriptional regulator, quorum-sensing system regulator BjaR1
MYRRDSWLAIPANGRVALTRRSPAKRRLLTPREREVLAWVARGKSAWEIGEILNIAKRTVDEHVQSAVRKLGAVNRTHAVALAIRDHLVEI